MCSQAKTHHFLNFYSNKRSQACLQDLRAMLSLLPFFYVEKDKSEKLTVDPQMNAFFCFTIFSSSKR